MRARHAATVSLLLAVSIVAGAFAATRTVHLGVQSAKVTTTSSSRVIARRTHQLDRFEASLHRALHKHPPRLPRIPHFKPIPKPSVPAAAPVTAAPAPRYHSAPPAVPRVVYVRPRKVITIHRHGGEHEHEHGGHGGGGHGGHDD